MRCRLVSGFAFAAGGTSTTIAAFVTVVHAPGPSPSITAVIA